MNSKCKGPEAEHAWHAERDRCQVNRGRVVEDNVRGITG